MDDNLDPRRDRLVAALYGELTEEEEREFHNLLAEDAELRAEWEELRGTREILGGWELPEAAPSFVFLTDEDPATAMPRVHAPGIRSWLRSLMSPPAWGFAAAAAALAVLLAAGFRVDRTEHGVFFRLGPPAPAVTSSLSAGTAENALDLGAPDRWIPPGPPSGVDAVPVSDLVSLQDLDGYTVGLMQVVSSLLDDRERRRNEELAYVLRNFYRELQSEQQRSYDDLRAQIDGVGIGLLMEQNRADARMQTIIEQSASREAKPAVPPSNGERIN